MHAVLHDQNHHRNPIAEFFENRGNHQRPVARRIGRDDEKRDLPG